MADARCVMRNQFFMPLGIIKRHFHTIGRGILDAPIGILGHGVHQRQGLETLQDAQWQGQAVLTLEHHPPSAGHDLVRGQRFAAIIQLVDGFVELIDSGLVDLHVTDGMAAVQSGTFWPSKSKGRPNRYLPKFMAISRVRCVCADMLWIARKRWNRDEMIKIMLILS